MSRSPLFSVVIPTYNRAEFVLKTLDSIFAQTFKDYEVIVVDDCSTDNTQQVLAPLADQGRIRLIRHDQNYERARARNTGMEKARGEFLTFIDSDDLMYPTNLEDAAAYIKENPTTKVFHNRYQLVDENNNFLTNFPCPSLDDHIQAITAGNFMGCLGDFIHREVYENYRFDTSPELKVSEDWFFWLKILADYKPGRIDKVNSGSVFHSNRSILKLNTDSLQRARTYLLEAIKNDPHLNQVYGKHLGRLEAGALLFASTTANFSREHTLALKYLCRAAMLDPGLILSTNFMKAFGIAVLRIDKGH